MLFHQVYDTLCIINVFIVSGFRKTAGKSPKTEKAESPLRNQIGISRADAEQQPHSPGIAEEFDVRKAVLYSEIMAPKFKEE